MIGDTAPISAWFLRSNDLSNYATGTVSPTIMQLDEAAGTMQSTPAFSMARGVYVDADTAWGLSQGDPEAKPVPNINPLAPKPTQIVFPNPSP